MNNEDYNLKSNFDKIKVNARKSLLGTFDNVGQNKYTDLISVREFEKKIKNKKNKEKTENFITGFYNLTKKQILDFEGLIKTTNVSNIDILNISSLNRIKFRNYFEIFEQIFGRYTKKREIFNLTNSVNSDNRQVLGENIIHNSGIFYAENFNIPIDSIEEAFENNIMNHIFYKEKK